MAKNLNPKQLEVLQRLASGQSYREIQDALDVSPATINRWRRKFASVLQEQTEEIAKEIAESISTSRLQSVGILQNALTHLDGLLYRAESIEEKLSVINMTLKAFQILNSPQIQGSVSIQQSEPENQVVVLLPSNGRDVKP